MATANMAPEDGATPEGVAGFPGVACSGDPDGDHGGRTQARTRALRAEALPPLGGATEGSAGDVRMARVTSRWLRGLVPISILMVSYAWTESVRPELVLQSGHTDGASAVAFSPDRRLLASAEEGGKVKLWSTLDWRQVRTLNVAGEGIRSVAFSPRSNLLAAGHNDRDRKPTVTIWQVTSGQQVAATTVVFSTLLSIGKVGFSPDGRWLAGCFCDAMAMSTQEGPPPIALSNMAGTGDAWTLEGRGDSVVDFAFAPAGDVLATLHRDATIGMWSLRSRRRTRIFSMAQGGVEASRSRWAGPRGIAFSPDGRWLAGVYETGPRRAEVVLWNLDTATEVRRLPLNEFDGGMNVRPAFSHDGKWLAASSVWLFAQPVVLWDTSTWRKMLGPAHAASEVAFSADGRTLAVSTGWLRGGRGIAIWDLAKRRLIKTLGGSVEAIDTLSFDAGDSVLLSSRRDSVTDVGRGDLRVFDFWALQEGQLGARWQVPSWGGSVNTRVHYTRDGRWLAVAVPGNLVVVDQATGQGRNLGTNSFSDLDVTPDARWLAAGYVRGGTLLTALDAFHGPVTLRREDDLVNHEETEAVAFGGPEGRSLATLMSSGEIRLWDPATRTEVGSLKGGSRAAPASSPGAHGPGLAFSPDGRWLVSTHRAPTLVLWDVRLERMWPLSDLPVSEVAFAPERQMFASCGRRLQIWDAATAGASKREPITLVDTTDADCTAVTFSKDGAWLASGRSDGTVQLWETRHWALRATLVSTAGDFGWLVASPDGLFDGSPDGWKQVLWRFGRDTLDVADAGAFFQDFYRPNLLAELMRDRAYQVPQSIASLDRRQPTIRLTVEGASPPVGEVSSESEVQTIADVRKPSPDAAENQVGPANAPSDKLRDFFGEGFAGSWHRTQRPGSTEPGVVQVLAESVSLQRQIEVVVEIEEASGGTDPLHAQGSGGRDARLFRNGLLVRAWHGDVLEGKARATLRTTVPIVAGENRLTAYCFNRDNIKSADVELVVWGDDSLKRPATAWIIVVGVDEYANRDYNLKYAVADARAFADTLRSEQSKLGDFGGIEVASLLNEDATKANFLLALQRLSGAHTGPVPVGAAGDLGRIEQSQPEDAVFLFWAGHGVADGARFYLVPHDLGYLGRRAALDTSGRAELLRHGISDIDMEEAFEGVDAKRIVFVIDACNSGQALEAEEKRRGPLNSKGLAQLAYEKGMYVLAAAQGYQAALEAAELGHGYLTHALVEEGLKARVADRAPKDGSVSLREWLDYAVQRVPDMQTTLMRSARKEGREIAFIEGEEALTDVEKRRTQRPRVYYRREPETTPFVIAGTASRARPDRTR